MIFIIGCGMTRLAIRQAIVTEVGIPVVRGVTVRALSREVAAGWCVAGLTVG